MEEQNRIERLIEELKQDRDELVVKLKLASMEAGDEWQKIDSKLNKLEDKAREIGGVTAQASKEVAAAAKLMGEEIRDGLKAIAKRL